MTEQELKDKCTPEFIKWMCEYAEGFDYREECKHDVDYFIWNNKKYFTSSNILFPLLIHRAVEGWNKKDVCRPIQILCNCISFITDEDDPASIEYGYDDNQYQPESLTQSECAMLHCLLDIFQEVTL